MRIQKIPQYWVSQYQGYLSDVYKRQALNITELRYLVAIKKWGSVSAAAKQLYAAQPNVSKALKHLEEEYGLRIFERSSTGMIPTEQGRRFIEQAARVLEEVDRLTEDAHHARERCAELRVMIPHATYASYAAVDFLKEAAGADQLRIHIREGGSMEALDFVLRRGYHLALLRYAAEDDYHYTCLLYTSRKPAGCAVCRHHPAAHRLLRHPRHAGKLSRQRHPRPAAPSSVPPRASRCV